MDMHIPFLVRVLPVSGPTNSVTVLPSYESAGATGADLIYVGPRIALGPGDRAVLGVGFSLEIPPGFEAQIRSRSELAADNGLFVLNSPSTIDSDYRGEVKVLLANFSHDTYIIQPKTRIAQLVICPVVRAEFYFSSKRETGDLGSTRLDIPNEDLKATKEGDYGYNVAKVRIVKQLIEAIGTWDSLSTQDADFGQQGQLMLVAEAAVKAYEPLTYLVAIIERFHRRIVNHRNQAAVWRDENYRLQEELKSMVSSVNPPEKEEAPCCREQ